MRDVYWINKKKFGNRTFSGSYGKTKKGERNFVLTSRDRHQREISFESWQMAVEVGWVRMS